MIFWQILDRNSSLSNSYLNALNCTRFMSNKKNKTRCFNWSEWAIAESTRSEFFNSLYSCNLFYSLIITGWSYSHLMLCFANSSFKISEKWHFLLSLLFVCFRSLLSRCLLKNVLWWTYLTKRWGKFFQILHNNYSQGFIICSLKNF